MEPTKAEDEHWENTAVYLKHVNTAIAVYYSEIYHKSPKKDAETKLITSLEMARRTRDEVNRIINELYLT